MHGQNTQIQLFILFLPFFNHSSFTHKALVDYRSKYFNSQKRMDRSPFLHIVNNRMKNRFDRALNISTVSGAPIN